MSSLSPFKASLLGLKPHKNEASLRIRNSSAALVAAFLLTQLTPAPSIWTAVDVVFYEPGEGKSPFWMFCAAGKQFYLLDSQGTFIHDCCRTSHTGSLHPKRPSGGCSAHVPAKISATHAVSVEEYHDTTATDTSACVVT